MSLSSKDSWELLESVPDAVLVVDARGKIVFINGLLSKMFGFTREDLIGREIETLIPERFRGTHVQDRTNYAKHPTTRTMGAGLDLYARKKNGVEIPVDISLCPISGKEGPFIMAAIRDVSEGKQKERLATMGLLSGNIAHELRNPLATIDSSAYFLKLKLKDADPKVQEHLERIKAAVKTATAVIQSLLDMTRMKTSPFAKIDLRTIVEESLAPYKTTATLELVRDFPAEPVFIHGDSHQLLMAFSNIVKNAVEAMGGQGRLTARLKKAEANQATLDFLDTGPGIPQENRDRIFQPLFSTKATGIGFGLAIAKMVVDRHQGRILAEHNPDGGGAIALRFPLYQGESA